MERCGMSAYLLSPLLGSHYPDHSVLFFLKTHEKHGLAYRYDEGTAFIPVVTHKRFLPVSDEFKFMALDEDGYDLPADW